MSFLYDRIIAHVDKATSDPQAEEQFKAKRAKLKGLIKTNQEFIDTQKKFLFNKTPKTISGEYVIAYEDIQLLKGILDELDDLNKKATEHGELTDKTEEIMGRYNSLARNAFLDNWSWSDKIPLKGRGVRFNYYNTINAIRQALHDFPDLPSQYKGPATDFISTMKDVLKNNLYTNDNSYDEGTHKLQQKYSTLITKMQDGMRGQKDDWDPKTGIMIKIYNHLMSKFLIKNRQHIDFVELPTDPPLFSDLIKSKEESDAAIAEKEKDTFSIWNVFKTATSTGLTIGITLLVFLLALMGASIAVNLNVYKPIPYRIICMFYGMLFSPIVLIYGLLYKGWWLNKQPVYYGFLPLIPYFFINKYTQFFLGWLTYRPDNRIWDLQEWRTYHN